MGMRMIRAGGILPVAARENVSMNKDLSVRKCMRVQKGAGKRRGEQKKQHAKKSDASPIGASQRVH
ncbi:MAG: hypothetical protein GF372_03755 [Candidatus Marinimicrobia bacterium]|nr:hypothetical protein [Candidatus Neomarinimicrobiota bacterium]